MILVICAIGARMAQYAAPGAAPGVVTMLIVGVIGCVFDEFNKPDQATR